MSCFQGLMREYTSVSLDRFDGRNLSSTVFFLSHCHKDHMVGLGSSRFLEKLQSRMDVFLYCSAVTQTLLLSDSQYRHLRKFIKVLDVGVPTTVTIPDKGCDVKKMSTVLVTPLGAGHCPGSLMFLFEGKEGTCLYTGDFRWETNHAQNLQAFKSGDSVKEIKSLYIDTTFCFEDAFHFPSRNDCAEAASVLVSRWLAQSPDHVVSVSCKSKYGHEHFLQELSISTHQKVHTSQEKCDVYQQIGDLRQVFTSDPAARIHSCTFVPGKSPLSPLPCGYVPEHGRDINVLVLRPSTMFFALNNHQYRNDDLIVYPKGSRGLHRVCYSFHSSYVEVRDLVMYLKPQRVFPNVIPPKEQDMSKVQARLNSFLKLVHLKHIPPMAAPNSVLGKLKVKRKVSHDSSQSDSDNLVFDSPVKIKPSSQQNQTSPSEGSAVDSSYEGSIIQDEGMDLTNTQDAGKEKPSLPLSSQELFGSKEKGDNVEDATLESTQESYCLYVSGDEDCDEEDRVSTVSYCAHDDVVVIESSQSQDDVCEIDIHDAAPETSGDGLSCVKADTSHQGDGDTGHGSQQGVSHGKACDGKGDKVISIREDEDEDLEIVDAASESGGGDSRGLKRKDESCHYSDISPEILEDAGGISLTKSQRTSHIDGDVCRTGDGVSQEKGDSVSQEQGDGVSQEKGDDVSEVNGDKESVSLENGDKVFSRKDGQTKSVCGKDNSFDLFDEGNTTDIEDNDEEDTAETQRFDADLASDAGTRGLTHKDKCTDKPLTDKLHADKHKEVAGDRASSMRLPIRPPLAMDSVEEIVILDSDDESDKESCFLSGGKDCMMSEFNKRRMPLSINSAEYARNLSNLVAKVEKRLASSDSDVSPRKKMRPDLSRNCESDSDATLPPSQGSSGGFFHRRLYYTDSESESDSDSEAVEILYETDANGDRFDVLGNPMPSQPSLMTVCVKSLNRPLVSSTTSCMDNSSNSSDVIDLTEEPEDDDCANRIHGNSNDKVKSNHDKVKSISEEIDSSDAKQDKHDSSHSKPDIDDSSHSKQDKDDSSHSKQDKDDSSHSKQDKDDSRHSKPDIDDSSHSKQDKDDSSHSKQDKHDSSHSKPDKDDSSHSKQDKDDSSHSKQDKDDSSHSKQDKDDSSHSKQDKDDSSHSKQDKDDSRHSKQDKDESGHDKEESSHGKQDEEDTNHEAMETSQDEIVTSQKVKSGQDSLKIITDEVESSSDKVETNCPE